MIRSHFASGNSSTGDTNWIPALYTSTSLDSVPDHRLDLRGLGHVRSRMQHLRTRAFGQAGTDALDFRSLPKPVEHHVRPGLGQRSRDAEFDPARGASDEGGFTF